MKADTSPGQMDMPPFLRGEPYRYCGFYNNVPFQGWFWSGWYQEELARGVGYHLSVPGFLSFRAGNACAAEKIYEETTAFLQEKITEKDRAYFFELARRLDSEAQRAFGIVESILSTEKGLHDPRAFASLVAAGQRLIFFWGMGYFCAMSFEKILRDASVYAGIAEDSIGDYIVSSPTPLLERQNDIRRLRALLESRFQTPLPDVADMEQIMQKDSELRAAFDTHLIRYRWVGYTMFLGKKMTILGLLSEVYSAHKSESVDQSTLSSEHPFAIYVDIAAQVLYMNQVGGEYFAMLGEKVDSLLTSLADTVQMSLPELLRICPNEVFNGSHLAVDLREKSMRRRGDEWCVYWDTAGVMITEDSNDVAALAVALVPRAQFNVDTISGSIGNKGFARGIVRVIRHMDEAEKMNNDNILVTGMTTPDFTPLMQRAAAIITDGGGLLCHAAIVSREMKKPCIIGTKIATQVLKDGDLVEVDAQRGVVKIMERAG